MPRPTNLRILSERVALPDASPDDRSASEVFTRTGAPVIADPALGEDVLALLRRSHDRLSEQAAQVATVAGDAVQRVERAEQEIREVAGLTTKAAKIAKEALATADAKSVVTSAVVGTAKQVSGSILGFLADRAPALFALVGGWLIAQQILADPNPMKLIGLALYSAGVVAPAVWLSSRRH